MKRPLLFLAFVAGLVPGIGQALSAPGSELPAPAATPHTAALTKEALVGRQVVDPRGETAGDVAAVMADKAGKLQQIVVKTAGKSVLVPIDDVQLQGDVVRTSRAAADVAKLPAAEIPSTEADAPR